MEQDRRTRTLWRTGIVCAAKVIVTGSNPHDDPEQASQQEDRDLRSLLEWNDAKSLGSICVDVMRGKWSLPYSRVFALVA